MSLLRSDADTIIREALASAQPCAAVRKALAEFEKPSGKTVLVAVGKASWAMAQAAYDAIGSEISRGIVITKYGHSKGAIGNLIIREAGHPVPDKNTYEATDEALEMVSELKSDDAVLFLLSGGGSALFESPLIPAQELQNAISRLLAAGADITQMNAVRKRFSAVKGGRFAERCAPARVFSVILSDVLGDRLDVIASGPTCPDASAKGEARRVMEKYGVTITPAMEKCLLDDTVSGCMNVENRITGSVKQLCQSAKATCESLGYEAIILTDEAVCTARDAGSLLGSMARSHRDCKRDTAFIMGGETVVKITGKGLGGRNQEIALSAAILLDGIENACVFSVGSDGTDGPTDAAGGYCDGSTLCSLKKLGLDAEAVLDDNDSYHALKAVDGLIITGPTQTNVNDLTVLLIRASC